MKEKKNIDRLFQEKFKDFEKSPKADMWDKISAELDKKSAPPKSKVIPLWMTLGSIAAVLAVILAVVLFNNHGQLFSNDPEVVFDNPETDNQNTNASDNNSETTKIADQQENSNAADSSKDQYSNQSNTNNQAGGSLATDHSAKDSQDSKSDSNSNKTTTTTAVAANTQNSANNPTSKADSGKKESNVKNNSTKGISSTDDASASKNKNKSDSRIASENPASVKTHEKEKISEMPESNPVDQSGILAENSEEENRQSEIDSAKTDILKEETALAETSENSEENDLSEAVKKKFQISTFAAPLFYKNIGSGSELSNQFANNSNSSEVTLAVGMKVAYQLSDKIKIRTGVSKMSVNNNIHGVASSPMALVNQIENISPANVNGNFDRINAPSPSEGSSFGSNNGSSFSLSNAILPIVDPGEIQQEFGFIEVPVEIEYALINTRFNLNLIGGASGLFLDENRVNLVTENASTEIGEANNINKTSFSTNLGVGLDYELNDQFSVGVEPVFKYQFNTFSNVNNVQPTNFGIYSGLKIKF